MNAGVWKKDRAASDSMQEACDFVALPWVLRQALGLLNVLQLEDNPDTFKTVLKAGGLMDVVEKYLWSGEEVEHSRRDKRRGKHYGRVHRGDDNDNSNSNQACIEVRWEAPYGGWCSDTFRLTGGKGDTLEQVTVMIMSETGERCKYRTVYHRVK